MKKFAVAALVLFAGILSAQVLEAFAQNYPSRQITLIVPFPPGG